MESSSVHRPSLCLTKKGLSRVQAPVDLRVQPNNPNLFSMSSLNGEPPRVMLDDHHLE